jgi:arylsulfatase A-like enzyme
MTSKCGSLLALLVAAGCGGREPAASPAAAPDAGASAAESRLRDFPLADPRHVELALLAYGSAQLAWYARGRGTLAVTIEEEGGATTKVAVALTGDPRRPAAHDLPGSGCRPLRITTSAPAGVTIELVRAKDEALALPEIGAMAGALRGRSLAIVACDALHADHLACYGSALPTSPHVDALAQQGVRAASLRSQTAWTLPSVATLFTGVTQERHGVRSVGEGIDESLPTLAEAFRAAGYATVAFLQNKLVTRESGLARGFDEWQEFPGESRNLLLPALKEFLARPRAKPLFLYVHFLPPHAPYAPPAEFAGRFGAPKGEADGSVEFLGRLARGEPKADDPQVAVMRALYDNHVAYGDALAGEVARTFLEPAREKSALLFLADHGESFAQHGIVGHNSQVYDELVHVPFVLVAPGSPLAAGRVLDAPLWMPDVAPTVRELFGLEPQAETAGRSFAGLLHEGARDDAGSDDAWRTRLLRLSSRWWNDEPPQRAIVFGSMKLVSPAGKRISALHDLATDPAEQIDVTASWPILAAALRQELASWVAEGVTKSSAARFTPDEKLRAELEALGYAGGNDHR